MAVAPRVVRRVEIAGLAAASIGLAAWWLGSMAGRPPAGLLILAAGIGLGVAIPGRGGSLAVLLAAGVVAQRLARHQLPDLAGSAGLVVAGARWLEAGGLIVAIAASTRRLAGPVTLEDAAGPLRIAGLLVLSAIGAELLAAYDDSTGRVGPLLVAVLFFAALYGAPALIMRELARRAGWGWPSIVLMAVAAGVLQAGVIDQSLFSADYRGLEGWTRSRHATFVEPLGISAHMALNFVLGHAIYSFCAPIAVAEAWRPAQARQPWSGTPGIVAAAGAYLAAAGLIATAPDSQSGSAGQLVGALLTATACVAAAVQAGRRSAQARRSAGRAPGVATALAGALALALVSTVLPETWPGVAAAIAVATIAAGSIARLSRRDGWSVRHAAAVALGFLLGRGLLAFTYFPLIGDVPAARKYTHNVVMLALVGLAGWLALRTPRNPAPSIDHAAGP